MLNKLSQSKNYFLRRLELDDDFDDCWAVNFINIWCTAFARADPKSVKNTDNLTVFFELLGSANMKACKTLTKLTPDATQ